jgi:predicted P-loop ATPase
MDNNPPKTVDYRKHKIKSISDLKNGTGKLSDLQKIEDYLTEQYSFRYNVISNDVEYQHNDDENDKWEILKTPSLWRELTKNHFRISQSNLDNLFSSDFVAEYNPFVDYFIHLKPWNKEADVDYIDKMALYIKARDADRFRHHFKKHLVRTVACALDDEYFNKHALILIGKKQNTGKSTWIRFLKPTKLKDYYSESFEADKDGEIAMSKNIILNLDELASLDKADIKKLKAYFSYTTINRRHPYGRKPVITPRRVSFYGSTNKTDFLTDETGSVRWLCFEIEGIDWSYTDMRIDDLWRQAYCLYKSGEFEYQLNSEEIKENERINKTYLKPSPAVDLINKFYTPGTKEDHDVFYSATDLLDNLAEKTNKKVPIHYVTIGKACTVLGFERKSVRLNGSVSPAYGYYVKFRNMDEYLNSMSI